MILDIRRRIKTGLEDIQISHLTISPGTETAVLAVINLIV